MSLSSSAPTRAELMVADCESGMAQAAAAIGTGDLEVAYGIITSP